jgi:hypothetical protein
VRSSVALRLACDRCDIFVVRALPVPHTVDDDRLLPDASLRGSARRALAFGRRTRSASCSPLPGSRLRDGLVSLAMIGVLALAGHAIHVWPHKLIESSTGTNELFDLDRDPGETVNLAAQEPHLVDALSKQLQTIAARHPLLHADVPAARMRPETEEALRALGYIQ